MENYHTALSKPKKLQELRPNTLTNKVKNVNYEASLDSDNSVKRAP